MGLFILSTFLYVFYLKYFPPVTTMLMVNRCSEKAPSKSGEPFKFRCTWKSYDEISPNIKMAIICAEDQKFPTHHGFDFDAIEKAVKNNMESQKIKGGSTISQQVAKNVFLWNGRSYIRKGLEVYFTALIELVWGKKRILEMYLNVAEMGNGIFGIEEAAKYYYKTSAAEISTYQAVRIAVSLPNPRVLSPLKPTAYGYRRIVGTLYWIRYLGGKKYLEGVER
ncbi:MAG: monofunctional biosynthetic peptidoglycan transglycosylase [Bacteroidetes bacterium]|nr:monofunctional biosynthetic peptidoglycan transglycosylase [Bacteroidota bacterium]